jgi:hypothetical protein
MLKRTGTVPLQVRISEGLDRALTARVKVEQAARELESSYSLKSILVEEALKLYFEGAPVIAALFEEILAKYDQAKRAQVGEESHHPETDLVALGAEVGGYRRRLAAILGGMPSLKKEG